MTLTQENVIVDESSTLNVGYDALNICRILNSMEFMVTAYNNTILMGYDPWISIVTHLQLCFKLGESFQIPFFLTYNMMVFVYDRNAVAFAR